MLLRLLCVVALGLVAAQPVLAQKTGTLQIELRPDTLGQAKGPAGLKVWITEVATGIPARAVTDRFGRARVTGLKPGLYQVKVSGRWSGKIGSRTGATYREVGAGKTLKVGFIGRGLKDPFLLLTSIKDAKEAVQDNQRKVVENILREIKIARDHDLDARDRLRKALPGYRRRQSNALIAPSLFKRFERAYRTAVSGRKDPTRAILNMYIGVGIKINAQERKLLRLPGANKAGTRKLIARQREALDRIFRFYRFLAQHQWELNLFEQEIKTVEKLLRAMKTAAGTGPPAQTHTKGKPFHAPGRSWPQDKLSGWIGKWNSNRGGLTITGQGSDLKVVPWPSEHLGSRRATIEVTSASATRVTGRWSIPSPDIKGEFVWTMAPDRRTFRGRFSQKPGGPKNREWVGQRVRTQ